MSPRIFVPLLLVTLTGCVPLFTAVRSEVVAPAPMGDTIVVDGPVKAFTHDGRIVLFRGNVRLGGGRIMGLGFVYDVTLDAGSSISDLSTDSVRLMVRVHDETVNAHVTAASAIVSAAGLVAIVFYALRVGALFSMPS